MKAFGLDINSIQPTKGQIGSEVGNKLVEGAKGTGDFSNLLELLGQSPTDGAGVNLDEVISKIKSGELSSDGFKDFLLGLEQKGALLNGEGKPISADKLLESLKTEGFLKNEDSLSLNKLEVRNLLKDHNLGIADKESNGPKLFTSGDDFFKNKQSVSKGVRLESNIAESGQLDKTFSPSKKMSALGKYSKESKSLETNILTGQQSLEMPGEAIGQPQFKLAEGDSLNNLATSKVIDLSNIKANDNESLINQVTKIIEQNSIKSADSMDVLVKHEDLGQFKIEVARNAETNELDLKIISKDKMGHNFFVENESKLAKTLTQSGLKLGDIKIALSSDNLFTSNGSEAGKDFGEGSENRGSQNFSQGKQHHENADAQRRRRLWEVFKEQAQYASA